MKNLEALKYELGTLRFDEMKIEQFNESEWLSTSDWFRMSCYLLACDVWKYNRKLQQFACACARQHWCNFLPATRRALQLSEIYADHNHFISISNAFYQSVDNAARNADPGIDTISHLCFIICNKIIDNAHLGFIAADCTKQYEHEIDRKPCSHYFRDLVYNPFRTPPSFDEEWLFRNDNAVYLLLQEIYYDYRYDLMPQLADLLEKARCTDAEILDHCRSTNLHIRGCWVVDGLLRPDLDPLKRILKRGVIKGDRVAEYLLSDDPKDPFSLYRG